MALPTPTPRTQEMKILMTMRKRVTRLDFFADPIASDGRIDAWCTIENPPEI